MRKLNKKYKGFTLIEAIMALGLLTIIAVLLLPSLGFMINASSEVKEENQIIFALETAIEKEKIKGPEIVYGERIVNINGVDITIKRSIYADNLDKIVASHGVYKLELIEVVNEKTWFHPN